jgi:ABC-type transporter Mla MlaB component
VLRITHSGSIELATVALEGKLLGPWVEELRALVANLGGIEALRLNLEGLSFADPGGIALLHELHRGGVELSGCSPLIAGLLASHQPAVIRPRATPPAQGRTHE